MNSTRSLQIDIPRPCSQSWDYMTPDGQGRHCAHCSKTVIDFTTWSDSELYGFFANKRGHVCGRFLSTQVGRQIHIPHQPHSRLYRMAIAMGLTLLFVHTPEVRAQSRPPIMAVDSVLMPEIKVKKTDSAMTEIRGVVTDNNKEPLVNATVQIFQHGIAKCGGVTDFDGNYSIRELDTGLYQLRVSYLGYKMVNQTVRINAGHLIVKNVILLLDPKMRNRVIVVREGLVDRRTINKK